MKEVYLAYVRSLKGINRALSKGFSEDAGRRLRVECGRMATSRSRLGGFLKEYTGFSSGSRFAPIEGRPSRTRTQWFDGSLRSWSLSCNLLL